MLFTDTVRKNLDPFDQHTDEDLWRALEEVRTPPSAPDTTDAFEIFFFL